MFENEVYLKEYLKDLNPSQLNAVTQAPGALLILAGPGSGKTRVLTTRIAHLVKQHSIKPNRCRAITFTRAATTEMKERLAKLGVADVVVSTIHGLAREIIDRFYYSHPYLMQMCSVAKRTAPLCWIDGMDESQLPMFKHNEQVYRATPEKFLYLAFGHVADSIFQGLDENETHASLERSIGMTEKLISDKQLSFTKRRRFWERLASYVSLFHLKNYVKNVLKQKIYAKLDPEDLTELEQILRPFLIHYPINFGNYLDSVALIYKRMLEAKGLIDYTGQLLWAHKILQRDEKILTEAQDLYDAYFVDEFQDTDPVQFDMLRLLAGQHKNITVVGDPNQAIYGFRGADVKGIYDFPETFPDANKVSLNINYRSTQQIVDASYAVVDDFQQDDWVRCQGEKEGKPVRFIQMLNEIESYPYNFTVLTRTNKGAKEIGQALLQSGILYKIRTQDNPIPHLGVPKVRVSPVIDILRAAEDLNDEQRILAAVQHVKGVGEKTFEHFLKNPHEIWHSSKTEAFLTWLAKGIPSVIDVCASSILKVKKLMEYLKATDIVLEIEYLTVVLSQFPNCPTYDELLDETSVEIRTIHSAKGLEYPRVVVDLRDFKPWNDSDDELAEECRILYVGMSRAEEELYLLGNNRKNFPNIVALKAFIKTQRKTEFIDKESDLIDKFFGLSR